MRIGIDVGGTNTDAVLVTADNQVLTTTKTSTTQDVTSGITTAIAALRAQAGFDPADVQAVMIGTTHFVNALVEAKRLAPTAVIRFGLPATSGLPPLVAWPRRLTEAIAGRGYLCHGGHEFDGRTISPLDRDEVLAAAADAVACGTRSIAISSVFSPVNADFELQAAELVAAEYPDLFLSLSHEIGRVGLLERENATVINACLRQVAEQVCTALTEALPSCPEWTTVWSSTSAGPPRTSARCSPASHARPRSRSRWPACGPTSACRTCCRSASAAAAWCVVPRT
jgi:N-methylhydantoinase A/oxoprolinase/acetone carboxylase beta subunit